jgi:arabinogalactan endo-1,4-beta-galactosidase
MPRQYAGQISRYNKKVMLCEAGMSWTDWLACQRFLADVIRKVRSLPGHMGLGVFYWEPESYNWMNYTKGAFNGSGAPTPALDVFE